MRYMIFVLTVSLVLTSCGGDEPADSPSQTPPADQPGHGGGSHHGAIVALGTVKLAGETFTIAREGECAPGKECAFAVSHVGETAPAVLYLWVENGAGEQVSTSVQDEGAGGHWHFHVSPQPDAQPTKVVLRLRQGDTDERASVPLHAGAAPRNHGICAPIADTNGQVVGWMELKLHDDKGDLELWLTTDSTMTQPMDTSPETKITATFPTLGDRTVRLKVRNSDGNEDEDGKTTMRDGMTNYFIFPGDTGTDASWLKGGAFKSVVTVTIGGWAATRASPAFVLTPHAHGPGGHDH